MFDLDLKFHLQNLCSYTYISCIRKQSNKSHEVLDTVQSGEISTTLKALDIPIIMPHRHHV